MPKLKTLRNWEKDYNIKLEWDVKPNENAENIRCFTCKDNDDQLQGLKNCNCAWIDGSKNATSDLVRRHVDTDMHKCAVDIEMKNILAPNNMLKMFGKTL